jgi:antitoxin VapB
MPLHICDPETDALVRRLAKERGVSLTEAVHWAVSCELARIDGAEVPLAERLAPIQARLKTYEKTGLVADKAFFDDLWSKS